MVSRYEQEERKMNKAECEACGYDVNVKRDHTGTELCETCMDEADRIDSEVTYGTRWGWGG